MFPMTPLTFARLLLLRPTGRPPPGSRDSGTKRSSALVLLPAGGCSQDVLYPSTAAGSRQKNVQTQTYKHVSHFAIFKSFRVSSAL